MTERPEQWFQRRATHYVEAQVLFHLGQAGVFHLLDARGPLSAELMARELDLVSEVLATCLDYICGVDALLQQDDAGCYGLTEFGAVVLARFGRDDGDAKHFNLFDVRVGAYGPVWSGLGRMLSGESRYGEGVERAGEVAAAAVYTVSARMMAPLRAAAGRPGVWRGAPGRRLRRDWRGFGPRIPWDRRRFTPESAGSDVGW